MSQVFIALGSNIGDRLAYMKRGKDALGQALEITAISPVYETEAVGESAGGTFLNAVVGGYTQLSLAELLSFCMSVEQQNDRVRTIQKGPRTLDLDILLYGDAIVGSESVSVPHPNMHERAFVLAPLADIAPGFIHPTKSVSIRELLERLGDVDGAVRRTEYVL